MAQSLFEHGQIRTTLPKAKDLRPFVERLITIARKARGGDLAARQRLVSLLGDRAIIPAEYQEQYEEMSDAARDRVLRSRSGRRHRTGQPRGGAPFTAVSVINHVINEIAGRYDDRQGGYTRVIRLGTSVKGDSAPMAVLQLIGEEESPGTVTRPEKTARRRRTERRYAAAAKAIKKSASGGGKAAADEPASAPAEAPQEEQTDGQESASSEE
jgi:large subunit ribosomal protein L17